MSTKNSLNPDAANPVLEAVIQTLQQPSGSAFLGWKEAADEGGYTHRESGYIDYDDYQDWLDWTDIKDK